MSSESPLYNPANNFEVDVRDVEYRRDADEALLARIYQPAGEGPFPAVVDVHGGVWSQGDRTNNAFLDQRLAASGLVVAAIDFRLAPRCPYPDQVADLNFAIRWLKAHTGEFNVEPRCIGALGTSSGGHTVLLSAMKPFDTRYTALPLPEAPDLDAAVNWVLALWPVIDPYARCQYAEETGRTQLVELTRGCFLTEEMMREGNPQLILERNEKVVLPPVLLVQGTADANIPMSIPERFTASYRATGGELDLELFPGMPHSFIGGEHPESLRAIEVIKKWIALQVEKTCI